jgi:hypothetical protein
VTLGKTTDGPRIRRAIEKAQMFDPRRENNTFEEARKEFVGEQNSLSRAQLEVRECEMPLTFDQYSLDRQGKEVIKIINFLYTCINLIKDEKSMLELQHLVR